MTRADDLLCAQLLAELDRRIDRAKPDRADRLRALRPLVRARAAQDPAGAAAEVRRFFANLDRLDSQID